MSDLGLDRATKELTLGYVTGLEALAQRVYLRLSRLQGEWYLSLDTGLPPEILTGRDRDLDTLSARIRAELLDVAGVLAVETLTLDLDAESRRLAITVRVRGVQGTTGVTL